MSEESTEQSTGLASVDTVVELRGGARGPAGRRARRGLRARPRAAAPSPGRRPGAIARAPTPAPGRRAGPPRAGPVARARRRAGRRPAGSPCPAAAATKPATGVTTDVAIVVRDDPDREEYVSRGGHKLAGALAAFGPPGCRVAGGGAWTPAPRRAGSPTCCCGRARREVVAVDVGYGQLAWPLRQDERVVVHDRTNVRELTPRRSAGRWTSWSATCRSSRCCWCSTRCSA